MKAYLLGAIALMVGCSGNVPDVCSAPSFDEACPTQVECSKLDGNTAEKASAFFSCMSNNASCSGKTECDVARSELYYCEASEYACNTEKVAESQVNDFCWASFLKLHPTCNK